MVVPDENDVLFGRGNAIFAYQGNIRFGLIVQNRKQEYLRAPKSEKRGIASEIVDEIGRLNPPGRFLMCADANITEQTTKWDKWVCVDREMAVKKVLHRLREKDKVHDSDSGSINVSPSCPELPLSGSPAASDLTREQSIDVYTEEMTEQRDKTGGSETFQYHQNQIGTSDMSIITSLDNASNVTSNYKTTGQLISIPLREWIKVPTPSQSTKEDYLKCTVDLALLLTQRLCQIAREEESSEEHCNILSAVPIELGDIVAENVLVACADDGGDQKTIHNVDIQSATLSQEDLFEAIFQDRSQDEPLNQRRVCHALGKILFELFTRGCLLSEVETIYPEQQDASFGELRLEDFDDILNPPTAKRQSSERVVSAAKTNLPMQAKAFLADLGLPQSICQLTSDLLDAGTEDGFMSDTAFQSLDEAERDLRNMQLYPESFLFDQTSPDAAMRRMDSVPLTDSDIHLYGREKEVSLLNNVSARLLRHNSHEGEDEGCRCEVVFLSGHAGSGKSSLIRNFTNTCELLKDCFLVNLSYAFTLCRLKIANGFDTLFQKLVPSLDDVQSQLDATSRQSLDAISNGIVTSVDEGGFNQLCELIPSMHNALSLIGPRRSNTTSNIEGQSTGTNEVGCGTNRLRYLFQILVRSICSEMKLLVVLDDLQWANAQAVEIFGSFVESVAEAQALDQKSSWRQGGLLVLGSYRDSEVGEDGFLLKQIKQLDRINVHVNVTQLSVKELSANDINTMLSFKLCVPFRLTHDLAEIVHRKTKGNPYFVKEFLQSIMSNTMLNFSVKERRWIWDDEVIDLQMISNGVAELLTKRLHSLAKDKRLALQIVSCIGFQVNGYLLRLLKESFPFDLMEALDSLVDEGLLEKAGGIYYAFPHDLLYEAAYSLIPVGERKTLHKLIALVLAKNDTNDQSTAGLAVDQINPWIKDKSILNQEERLLFAKLNLKAGKQAVATCCFSQSRDNFEAGIALLAGNRWNAQYRLSLELYENSAMASFMAGNFDTMPSRLEEILSNAASLQDTLTASALLAKLLASKGQVASAMSNCLDVLQNLGESFPREPSYSDAMNEIDSTRMLLRGMTKEHFKLLPEMRDPTKLDVMRFLSLCCAFADRSMSMLLPFICCRMLQLTLKCGFTDDSLIGLAMISHSLIMFVNDIQLAYHVSKIASLLIENHPQRHFLRAKLAAIYHDQSRWFVEPLQSIRCSYIDTYQSSMIVGDIDSAMNSAYCFCMAGLLEGMKMDTLEENFAWLMQDLVRTFLGVYSCRRFPNDNSHLFICIQTKHQHVLVLNLSMATAHQFVALSGSNLLTDYRFEVNSLQELREVARTTNNVLHEYLIDTVDMLLKCYFREYTSVVEIATKYRSVKAKRVIDIFRVFYGGLASLVLARDTQQDEFRQIGEKLSFML
ncbi:predicted protein [Thalassiosira pseudonana CCMP1335]|uniref:Uncharacterized protein n=1 Tax=Thalassiosira pseudonana TaxID=35128 RepID=B8CAT1_THAPS|nr:predicted protein [Thalassiosira pseudonana CCMP1335]EED89735.1 predicted protein [Thalassiosira pseudonana CCMP1335]